MASKTYDDYYKQALTELEAKRREEKRRLEEDYDKNVKKSESERTRALIDAEEKAGTAYNKSEITRLVNEKKLAERLNALGLANSGYADAAYEGAASEEKKSDKDTYREKKNSDKKANSDADSTVNTLNREYAEDIADVDTKYNETAKSQAEKQLAKDEAAAKKTEAAAKKSASAASKKASESADDSEKEILERRKNAYKLLVAKIRNIISKGKVYGKTVSATNRDKVFELMTSFDKTYADKKYKLTDYEIEYLAGLAQADTSYYEAYFKKHNYNGIATPKLAGSVPTSLKGLSELKRR